MLKDVVRTGTVGEDYITEEKNISGYTFKEFEVIQKVNIRIKFRP
ncbi:hypothetical protein P9166_08220 [Lactococcus lactis]|nr:hypothetical protein P9166_08220 [Lactococcus lactis]